MYSVQTYLLFFDKIFRFQNYTTNQIYLLYTTTTTYSQLYVYMHTTHNILILSLLRKKQNNYFLIS